MTQVGAQGTGTPRRSAALDVTPQNIAAMARIATGPIGSATRVCLSPVTLLMA